MKLDRNGDAVWSATRDKFEEEKRIYDSAILTFKGLEEGYDVYNCSIPFVYNGEKYIFGRVEHHNAWATSKVYIFKETEQDVFERVTDASSHLLEDPFVALINGEMIFGGVNVTKMKSEPICYRTCFYKGKNPFDLFYFTTGPEMMKDIRLVQLPEGVGVFSRPEGYVGFTVIDSIDDLDAEVIANAPMTDFIEKDGYGGVNQCYYLESGMIGIIGHMVYPKLNKDGKTERVYINTAAVYDYKSRKTVMHKVIGTRRCYPASEHMRMSNYGVFLDDTAFTSGIVMREDGKADLYSGLSDALEGRATIDYPFEGYGKIINGGNILN